ncbi:fatty acid amide hydrolase [Selaginella moellendorffii]|nr:fatty acid amide hydrolase [Selaginella moellendorffii]|eukprot:XP_024523804.1 fatty acid amide hydrolase [Selaginella moellendorffii]
MRYRQMYYHMEIFKNADVIVTPTTAATAPSISLDALECGELNYVYGAKLMRYQIAGNFIGLPAISVPVGFDQAGMPIGIQLIGKPWSEATLLRLAYVIEGLCAAESRRPEVLFDLLL